MWSSSSPSYMQVSCECEQQVNSNLIAGVDPVQADASSSMLARDQRHLCARSAAIMFLVGGILMLVNAVFAAWPKGPSGNHYGGAYQDAVAKFEQFVANVPTKADDISVDGVSVDVIIRDFTNHHPDFEMYLPDPILTAAQGLVSDKLGSDGKPILKNKGTWIHNAKSFDQWYHNDPQVNRVVHQQLALTPSAEGTLIFDSHEFFPLDGKGWRDETMGHNFWFTLEMHHEFVYYGGERFTFRGDDDLWVFVNKTLALDLGGVHVELEKTLMLDDLGLTKGQTASLDIFYAERHTQESHFRIETTIKLKKVKAESTTTTTATTTTTTTMTTTTTTTTTVKLWDDSCEKHGKEFPYLVLRDLIHNNLGGFGPGCGEESLVFRAQALGQGHRPQDVELRVRVKPDSRYEPASNEQNGMSHHDGVIFLKAGSSASLLFSFHNLTTREPMKLADVSLTFYNLHVGHDGNSRQYVEALGYDTMTMMSHTDVKCTKHDGITRFTGTAEGSEYDEPANPAAITLAQENRAITLGYKSLQETEVELGTTLASSTDSRFVFVPKPALLCAAMWANPEAENIPIMSGLPTQTSTTRRAAQRPTQFLHTTSTTTSLAAEKCCALEFPRLGIRLLCSESRC